MSEAMASRAAAGGLFALVILGLDYAVHPATAILAGVAVGAMIGLALWGGNNR